MQKYRLRSQANGKSKPTRSGSTTSVTEAKPLVLQVTISRPSIKNASAKALSILSSAEVRDLVACEDVIAKGWDTFLAVGKALAQIRDKRLYRADFDTFEAYCRQKWQYGKSQAYRLMGAAEVIQHLSPIGDIPLPRYESQVRPLLGLKPDQVKVVWREAVQKAGRESVTAKLVTEMAAQFRPEKPINRKDRKPEQVKRLIEAEKLLQKAARTLAVGDIPETLRLLDQLRNLLAAPILKP